MKKKRTLAGMLLLVALTVLMSVNVFATPHFELSKAKMTIYKGQTVTLKASYEEKNVKATSAKWKTSNKKIATVTKKGVVKGVKAGKATITCTYKNVKTKCVVTVKNPVTSVDVKTSAVKITTTGGKNQATVNIGKTVPLKVYYVTKTNKTTAKQVAASKCTFKSNKASVATISKAGKITAKKAGTALITVTYNKKSYKLYVTVKKAGTTTVTPAPTHAHTYVKTKVKATFKQDGAVLKVICGDCGKTFSNEEEWYDTCVAPELELDRKDPAAWRKKHPDGIYWYPEIGVATYTNYIYEYVCSGCGEYKYKNHQHFFKYNANKNADYCDCGLKLEHAN